FRVFFFPLSGKGSVASLPAGLPCETTFLIYHPFLFPSTPFFFFFRLFSLFFFSESFDGSARYLNPYQH
ncbi:hypothetical protein AALA24_13225, partial [Anaerovoracaceae bacterium 42-11]